MDSFNQLGLKKDIVEILSYLKFNKPTDVQKDIIPLAQTGKNIVFTARTGSGKTLAFLLGNINRINTKQGTQMLVLVPTRELCIQVAKELTKICELLNINVGMLYGGREIAGDYRTTSKKNQILVGTPGRLIQHIDAKRIKVGEVKYLVYDESDQMFDHGFYEDCVYVKSRVSKSAQIIFSSATITEKVEEFMRKEIKNFEFKEIGDLIPKNISQEAVYCDKKEVDDLLLAFLKEKEFEKAIIFCNTKKRSYLLEELFKQTSFKAKALNSDLTQDQRNGLLNAFKHGKIELLIATDVASRGIHIDDVDMVINYEVARKPEFHVHRMGRSGRNDKKGYAISFICNEDIDRYANICEIYSIKETRLTKDFKPDTEEKIIVVNGEDKPVGIASREDVDAKKKIYRVSALWIMDQDGNILLAKRAYTKKHDPGKWGPAVAGTVEAGESYHFNIVKEAEEELGITDIEFDEFEKTRVRREYHHFTQWFTCVLDAETDFTLQKEEVAEIKWFSKEDMEDLFIQNPDAFTSGMDDYFDLFIRDY